MDAATRNLLIFVQLCFGIFPWLGKIAMDGFTPRAVLVWRLLAGSLVLLLLAVRVHGRRAWPGWRDLAELLGLSVLGITINQLLFLEGLHRSTAVNAGLLITLIPVATVGLALILRQEQPSARRLTGIGLSVAGVAWLFVTRGASVGGDTTTGDLMMVANCLAYSLYLVLGKSVLRRVPQLVVLAWMFLFGALTVPWFARDVSWAPPDATGPQWAALIGIVVFPTIVAYLGNIIVLARTSASTTAAYVLLQPLITGALGIGLLGERPEPAILVTAAGVLSGLWLVTTAGRRTRAAAPDTSG